MKLRQFLFLLLLLNNFIINAGTKFNKKPATMSPNIPIIFNSNYDISFMGLEKLHPFDSAKYGKIDSYLRNKYDINKFQFYKPEMISEKDLLLVHTSDYLERLKNSNYVAQIAELQPLAYVPNFLVQRCLLNPMKFATAGTVLGAQLALEKNIDGTLKYGWAINLSGGYHHAKANSGEGFCFFNDIVLACYKLWQKQEYKNLKILILDLDAHQGNGHESILKNHPNVAILDVYNGDVYPKDNESKKGIKLYDFPVKSKINDKNYLSIVKTSLEKAVNTEKPGLIIYNAGTDIFEKDPLGQMSVSQKGIIERDFIVFKMAIEQKIPIIMVLSGGYTSESAQIISKSIENIIENLLKKHKMIRV